MTRIKDVDDLKCTPTRCGRLQAAGYALMAEAQEPRGRLHIHFDESLDTLAVCELKLLYVLFTLVRALAIRKAPMKDLLEIAYEALLEKGELTQVEVVDLRCTFDRLLSNLEATEKDVNQFLRSTSSKESTKERRT